MLVSYFKTAFRNLLKHKGFSILNISGLAIGMAACFLVFQYVHFQKSFDSFNTHSPRVFRVLTGDNQQDGGSSANPAIAPAIGPALARNFPEIEAVARIAPTRLLMRSFNLTWDRPDNGPVSFNETNVFFADQSIFTIFSFPIVRGDKDSALTDYHSLALSESTARKYFGQENPIGQTLNVNGLYLATVKAVFKDIPENSHLRFDILTAFPNGTAYANDEFAWPEFYTYLMLKPGADPKKLAAKFPGFEDTYLNESVKLFGYRTLLSLQPLTRIYLHSNYQSAIGISGNYREIGFLSLIGILVLLIAWTNYINLSTSKGFQRASEIGVRKAVGAGKRQLAIQFFTETLLVFLVALLLSALLVILALPSFGKFVAIQHPFSDLSTGLLHEPNFWLIAAGTFCGGVLLSGAYPAFVLSGFNPVLVFKGKFTQSTTGVLLRKGLVLFQFSLSVLLIAGSFLIYKQLWFMRNVAPGYNNQQLLVCKAPPFSDSTYDEKINSLKSQLLQLSHVEGVTESSDVPGETIVYGNSIRRSDQAMKASTDTYMSEIDSRFIPTYQIKIVAGRNFDDITGADLRQVNERRGQARPFNALINETLAKKLGFRDPQSAIGKLVIVGTGDGETTSPVIGVVKDYHQKGLKDQYEGIFYYFPNRTNWKYISIRLNAVNISRTMTQVQDVFHAVFPGKPFDSLFLDEFFGRQYASEEKFGSIFGIFTGLAIFVSCLGLLGLSSFTVIIRRREIGIRKILGASVASILGLLYKGFFQIVILASLISVPLFYFAGNAWLSNYAFHVRITLEYLLIPVSILLFITLITVAGQSLKSATTNPTKSLRD